jgi:hypothetical protein
MGWVSMILPVSAMMVATAWAQGSGNVPLAEMGTGGDANSDWPFQVTRTVTGNVLWIMKNGDINLIVVEDNRGRRAVFTVTQQTRFKADKKTEYAGKKRITADDMAVGQRVTIIFTPDKGNVLALRFMQKAMPKKAAALIGVPSAAPAAGSSS